MSYTEQARQYILNKFEEAKESGQKYIELTSKEIHEDLGFSNRYPIVCNAMQQLKTDKDEFISTTLSGQSSTIAIRYILINK